jgi:cytochrome b561
MQILHSENNYGIVAKTLHWLIALLIIVAWIVGFYAIDLPNTDSSKGMLYELHKSVGMAVLMLVIIRLSWRLYDGSPGFAGMNPLLATAAKTVHYLLYVFMFVQPLSGWAMSSAAGYNPTFFGLFTFPGLVSKNPKLVPELVGLHNTSAMLLLTLFILHVGGALFHHFVLKDRTLLRMTTD